MDESVGWNNLRAELLKLEGTPLPGAGPRRSRPGWSHGSERGSHPRGNWGACCERNPGYPVVMASEC